MKTNKEKLALSIQSALDDVDTALNQIKEDVVIDNSNMWRLFGLCSKLLEAQNTLMEAQKSLASSDIYTS
jgi:hypothetical protein